MAANSRMFPILLEIWGYSLALNYKSVPFGEQSFIE